MWKIMSLLPRKIKIMAVFAIIISILQPFLSMTIPTVSKQLVSFLASANKNNNLTVYFIKPEWEIGTYGSGYALGIIISMTLGFAFLLIIIAYLSGLLTVRTKIYGSYYVRKIVFEHLLTFSRRNIDKITVSTLITRFSNDINKISEGFFIICRGIFISPFFVAWGLTFALITNLYLSISIAAVIPFMIGAAILAIYKLFPLYRKENRMLDKLNEVVKEDINAVSFIKSYNLEAHQYARFSKATDDLMAISRKAAKLDSIAWPLIDLIVLFGNIVLFSIIALVIANVHNAKDVRNLVANIYQFTSYMTMISIGIYMTLFVLNKLFRSNISASRIMEILNTKPEINYVKNQNKITKGEIEINDLSFGFTDELILKNINLKIKAGQTIGILGKTGSGKSTLVKLLTREYDLKGANDKGQIFIDGFDIKEIDTNNLYSKMTAVFQKPIILSGTILSNLTFGLKNYSDSQLQQAIDLSCSNFINNFSNKQNQEVSQRGMNLSGGQRQRIAIAQALIKEPKILILDDALSALDNKTDLQIRKNIKNHFKNTTMIIVSQRIKTIKDCDQIVVLDNGQINEIGHHNDLIKNNQIYKEIYLLQESEDK